MDVSCFSIGLLTSSEKSKIDDGTCGFIQFWTCSGVSLFSSVRLYIDIDIYILPFVSSKAMWPCSFKQFHLVHTCFSQPCNVSKCTDCQMLCFLG